MVINSLQKYNTLEILKRLYVEYKQKDKNYTVSGYYMYVEDKIGMPPKYVSEYIYYIWD